MATVKCGVCNKDFWTITKTKKYCSDECKKVAVARNSKRWREGITQKKSKPKKPNQDLIDIATAAREAGMTYGQYVASKMC